MNCREAHDQILAERDGALGSPERAALISHVEQCGACRRVREDLTATLSLWQTTARNVVVPDAEREWHAVRRKIRGGVESGEVRLTPHRPAFLTWLAVPVAAAAALALALFIAQPGGGDSGKGASSNFTRVARAESVDAGRNASTMVYMDDKSGWLIVLASDDKSSAD
jgi:hypothetical protein